MMATCRNMDSYPYQRSQMPFPLYHYPNIDANPPQMKMEPPKPPFPYEQPWTYAGNYGHPMNFCCGHYGVPGCYGYRPSYHHHAPVPSPMYYSAAAGGGYPAYGEPSFVPYPPQPHYTMELPRYEYDKYMPRDYHCCGCPNHRCNQSDAKGTVKIEEEEPDAGKRVNDDDALAPVQMRNYPYPIVWIPAEYTRNKEAKNAAPIATEVGEQLDKTFHDRKPGSQRNLRADAEEPKVRWNGSIPYDMNHVPIMVHEGDGRRRRSQNLQGENNNIRESEDGRWNHKIQSYPKRSEFPFPIIWMPYYNKQDEESGKENNQSNNSSPKCIEEVPHSIKSVPANPPIADEGATNEMRSNQDEPKKVTNEKIIPVKEVELQQGKNDSEGSGVKRESTIPVHQIEENVTKKETHTGREKLSTSPGKNGKLPPVCLRVDPLPRKKSGNGSSRSPSPPESKQHSKSTVDGKAHLNSTGSPAESKQPSKATMVGKAHLNSNGQNDLNIGEKVKPKERTDAVSETKLKERTIAVSETKTSDKAPSGSMNDKVELDSSPQNAPITSEKVKPKERTIQVNENKTHEKKEAKEDEKEDKAEKGVEIMAEEGGKEKKKLSDVDAAVLIQAAYRGYQVRRWEPLKKLKQIHEVTKELTNVRGRVEALENSSDLQSDEKQRIAVGETIMRLLLKLDTIQGLHSNFRETRKSLARELISLQERLDSVMAKKPQQQTQDIANTKHAEETPVSMQNEEYVQQQLEEKAAVPTEDSASIFPDMVDKCDDQSGLKDGIASQSPIDSETNAGDEPIALPNAIVDECNPASDVSESDKMVVEPEAKLEAENIPIEVDNSDVNAWKELPVGVIDEDATDHSSKKDEQNDHSIAVEHDSASIEEDSYINPMRELPVGVIDEDTETSELGKDDGNKVSEVEAQCEDVESLVELPVGVLDEGTMKPESENHFDEPETSKEVEGGQCNVDENTSFAKDDTAKEIRLDQQLEEEQEEVKSSGESDGWVKVEFQKEDKPKGDVSQDIELEFEEETKNEAESPNLETQDNGDECSEESKESVTSIEIQGTAAVQENSGNNEKTESLAEEKTELSAALPGSEELNGDRKLLEENEKLREMMRKLLEAGNEQMNVISDLTGRVKDLEKRLTRSKRVRTKRFKSVTSKTRSNDNSSSHDRVH